jgi:hypothetical protein
LTAFCSGASSTYKAAFGATAYVVPATLGAILSAVPIAWAAPLAAYLGAITYDLSTFCTTDPPADPSITAADVIDFLNFANPILHHAGALKIQQLFDRYAWFAMCECVGVSTPATPAGPSAPVGLPDINPPIIGPTVNPCGQFSGGPKSFVGGAVDTPLVGTATASLAGSVGIPAGSTNFRVTYTNASAGTVHHTAHFITRFWSQAGSNLGGDSADVASGATTTKVVAVPANAVAVQVITQDLFTPPDSTNQVSALLELFCGSSPGQTQSSCCPPDPILTAMLLQIIGNVQLIQRQLAPFAYVPGTVHSGLSGSGVIGISGLLGCKINVTTIPTQIGREGTAPVEYFDMGFITFGTADGYPQAYRLERAQQLLLPARASAFTDLAYDLHPGVVCDITELLREP